MMLKNAKNLVSSPKHGPDGCLGRSGGLVVLEVGDEPLDGAAAVVDQLQRRLRLVEREAPANQDVVVG